MKIKYSPDVDVLLIELKEGTPSNAVDLEEGIILHLNENNDPLEIEILDAATVTNIEEIGLSIPTAKVA